MITKYTSIKRVVSKVLTDLNLHDGDHRIPDILEFAAEAIEKIGAFPYFTTKVTGKEDEPALQLIDYQVKLPMGAHKIIQVAYAEVEHGPFYPMRYNTGTFDSCPKPHGADNSTETYTFSENELVWLAMDVYDLSYALAAEKLNNDEATKSLMQSLLSKKASYPTSNRGGKVQANQYTYVVNGGYIKTNVQNGYLMVAYQSIPLDIDGYPLIPDDVSFIEALYWYVVMKLYYPEWKDGRLRDAVYYDAKRSWNYYCKQAYGNALMPNADEMESIKNVWIRLIPDLNAHSTFYTKLGDQEKFYNQDNPRYSSHYEKVINK